MARELRVISNNQKVRQPKPEWLRIRLGDPVNQNKVLELIEGLNLHTVCQEARCPNIFECWSDRTATSVRAIAGSARSVKASPEISIPRNRGMLLKLWAI